LADLTEQGHGESSSDAPVNGEVFCCAAPLLSPAPDGSLLCEGFGAEGCFGYCMVLGNGPPCFANCAVDCGGECSTATNFFREDGDVCELGDMVCCCARKTAAAEPMPRMPDFPSCKDWCFSGGYARVDIDGTAPVCTTPRKPERACAGARREHPRRCLHPHCLMPSASTTSPRTRRAHVRRWRLRPRGGVLPRDGYALRLRQNMLPRRQQEVPLLVVSPARTSLRIARPARCARVCAPFGQTRSKLTRAQRTRAQLVAASIWRTAAWRSSRAAAWRLACSRWARAVRRRRGVARRRERLVGALLFAR